MKEADSFYLSKLWPLIKQKFVSQHRPEQLKEVYGLIQIVGSSPEPLILSLSFLQPERVFFIYTEDYGANVNRILEETGLIKRPDIVDKPPVAVHSSDVAEIYRLVKECWVNWRPKSGGKSIVLDITGGKKSMIAGAAMAAALLDLKVCYVDSNEYLPVARRPKPGTEYLLVLPNPFATLGEIKLSKAIELFNRAEYELSSRIFVEVIEGLQGLIASNIYLRTEVFHDLSIVYQKWDSFDFKGAVVPLRRVVSKLEKGFFPDLVAYYTKIKHQIEILEVLSRNQEEEDKFRNLILNKDLVGYRDRVGTSFFNLLQEVDFSKNLILTLLATAERLAIRGHYSDSVMRLYRALELISQHRLAIRGISTVRPNMPNDLIEKVIELNQRTWITYDIQTAPAFRIASGLHHSVCVTRCGLDD